MKTAYFLASISVLTCALAPTSFCYDDFEFDCARDAKAAYEPTKTSQEISRSSVPSITTNQPAAPTCDTAWVTTNNTQTIIHIPDCCHEEWTNIVREAAQEIEQPAIQQPINAPCISENDKPYKPYKPLKPSQQQSMTNSSDDEPMYQPSFSHQPSKTEKSIIATVLTSFGSIALYNSLKNQKTCSLGATIVKSLMSAASILMGISIITE